MAPPDRVRFRDIADSKMQVSNLPSPREREQREKTQIQAARNEFFDGRTDAGVPESRVFNRLTQDRETDKFKKSLVDKGRVVTGLTTSSGGPVFLSDVDARGNPTESLVDRKNELARLYGPNFSQVLSDIGYGVGKTMKAVGIPFISTISRLTGAFNKDYDRLNDVQKEIFENPDKYPNASNIPVIQTQNNSRQLLVDADKVALGLESTAQDARGIPAIGSGSGFDEQPSDLFGAGLTTLPVPKTKIEFPTTEPVFPAEKIKQSSLDRFSPEYIEQQKALLDELNISPQVAELLGPNLAGGGEEEFYVSPGDQDIDASSGAYGASAIDKTPFLARTTSPRGFVDLKRGELGQLLGGGKTEGTQVTAFNNPGNLTDVGQAGTTGETYGNNFAVFPNAQAGITALENDLELKVNRSNKVEDIIGQYAAGDPNVGRYIDFVTDRVGPTVDQNELDDLRDAVIRFENKPDIAQQYLALVAEGGLMDKKMYGGIIASKG